MYVFTEKVKKEENMISVGLGVLVADRG